MKFSEENLKEVKVTLISEDPRIFQCDQCGLKWKPFMRKDGKFTKNYYVCLNGCNAKYMNDPRLIG